ncbi:tc_p032 [Abalone herpesvirus Taiwan/2004]|uniref:Uncharacterized protein n=1 Tax=Abalone herpesvirus Taiwan/2005 TaxID=1821058 RepID=A0A145VV40_9VIRU|nr:tc_p032 [Abalone herpesvirus Taiwan/2004]AMW36226.1 hypothetical protein tc2005_p084 [Abalone herpesvirus Taiwan/2005]UCX57028.1 ORF37 [Haliotid herpesvirus 1]
MAGKQMQMNMALNNEAINHNMNALIEKMIDENETGIVPYNGGFVAYPVEYVTPRRGVLFSQNFNVSIINGAGTVDTQGVTPGVTFPQFPMTLGIVQAETKMQAGNRFCPTTIVLHNGQVFDKHSELISTPESASDDALVALGEKFAEMNFPGEFTKQSEGCVNKLANPFAENNLPEFVDYIFKEYFPTLDMKTHVLLFIGDTPTMISVAKHHILGKEDVNKYNSFTKHGKTIMTADHRMGISKATIAVPFTNKNLKDDCSGCLAYVRPVFHASNSTFFNEHGSLPYDQTEAAHSTTMVQNYFKLHETLIGKMSEMPTLKPNKFMGLTAATIALSTPVMMDVEVVDKSDEPLMLINARLDIVNSAGFLAQQPNKNVKVDQNELFAFAYSVSAENLQHSQCTALSYRNSFADDNSPCNTESMKDQKKNGKPVRQIFTHNTDRACSVSSYVNGHDKLPADQPDDIRQLQASMLGTPNELIQLFDHKSTFRTNKLESRKQVMEKNEVAIEEKKMKEVGWLSALKAAPNMTPAMVADPAMRILTVLGGSIFRLKSVLQKCLFMIDSRCSMRPGMEHPSTSKDEPTTTLCKFCDTEFVTSDSEFCRCALMTSAVCTLKKDPVKTALKVQHAWTTCFALETAQEVDKKVKNVKMETYAFNLSLRSDDLKSNTSSTGNATFVNKADEYGFISKEAYEERKSKREKKKEEEKKKAAGGEGSSNTTGAEASTGEDDPTAVDFNKCLKLTSLISRVMSKVDTILPEGQYIDFSEMSQDEIDALSPSMKQHYENYRGAVKTFFEIEKGSSFDKNKAGSLCFAPELALLTEMQTDAFSTTDYKVTPFQIGMDEIEVKGTAPTLKSVSVPVNSSKIMVDNGIEGGSEEGVEDFFLKGLDQQRLENRKRKAEDDANAQTSKKQMREKITPELKNIVIAIYDYSVKCMQDKELFKSFSYEKIPESYRQCISSPKFYGVGRFIKQRMTMDFASVTEEDKMFSNLFEDALVKNVKGLADYFQSVSDVIKEECHFASHELMHERFTNDVSLLQDGYDKVLHCVIDPHSTSSFIQKTSERKMLNMMGKQSKDVNTLLNKACALNRENLKVALTDKNVPHLVTMEIAIPYKFLSMTEDQATGFPIMEFPPTSTSVNAIHPELQSVFTTMRIKVKVSTLANERKEVESERWDDLKTNTKKLEQEMFRLRDSEEITGGSYVPFPITCKDHVENGGMSTGAGTWGPLATSLIYINHKKNNVKYHRVGRQDFCQNTHALKGVDYVCNFMEELLGSKQANNEVHNFATLCKLIVNQLNQLDIAQGMIIEKFISVLSTTMSLSPKQSANVVGTRKKAVKFFNRIFYGGEEKPKISLGERFTKTARDLLTKNSDLVPILHLLFSSSQIYGGKNNVEGKLYNIDMERDMQAALVCTSAITQLSTSGKLGKDSKDTTPANKRKQVGLGTLIKCHSNYSMLTNQPVTVCSMGDQQYAGQSRNIFRGCLSSYPGYDSNIIMRSMNLNNKAFFAGSLPALVVNQGTAMIQTACGVIIKTAPIHNTKSVRVAKSINPAEILATGDINFICAHLSNSKGPIKKKFADYICVAVYGGGDMLPGNMEALTKDIVDNFFGGVNDLTAVKRVEEQIVKPLAHLIVPGLEEEAEEEETCEDENEIDLFADFEF